MVKIINDPCISIYHHFKLGYFKGKKFIYHNDIGPAIETCQGLKWWYHHGTPHRVDGPACYFDDKDYELHKLYHKEYPQWRASQCRWYYEGKQVDVSSQEEFEKWLKYRNF
jgi:hypothetical protein